MSSQRRRTELDELDRALVAQLERDGRVSNVELAKRLRVSEKTVRARIARLIAEHGLVVTAELPQSERRSRMVYLVRTDPGRRVQVAELLADCPEVEAVHLVTGAADLVVAARFRDDAAAVQFQLDAIEQGRGVRSVRTCHVIETVGGPDRGVDPSNPQANTGVLSALMLSTSSHSEAKVLDEAICDAAIAGLGADRVAIAVQDASRPFGVTASRGLSAHYVTSVVDLVQRGRADGVVKRVWQTRLHLLVADALTDPLLAEVRELVRGEGYRGLLVLPVLFGDSMLATVSLYWNRPVELNDAYLAIAQSTVDHFAVAFSRVRGLAPNHTAETSSRHPTNRPVGDQAASDSA